MGFYIREGLTFKVIDNLSTFHDKFYELLTLDITYNVDNSTKRLLVTSIYRSPSTIHGTTMSQQLEDLHHNLDNLMTDISWTPTSTYSNSTLTIMNLIT